MFYIDESGTMPTTLDKRRKYRYFVISFVHTNNPEKLKSVYKNAIRTLREKYSDFFAALPNPKELKGSQMLPHMKLYIIQKLKRLTDVRIAHMVVDNWNIEQRFRDIPGRSFNYLVELIIENFALTDADKRNLLLCIDNRNVALEGLRELEGHLYYELVLKQQAIDSVKVIYLESCDNYNIQVADMIAHTIYQRFRYKTMPFPKYAALTQSENLCHPYTYEYLYNELKPLIKVPFVFPPRGDLIKDAAATFEL